MHFFRQFIGLNSLVYQFLNVIIFLYFELHYCLFQFQVYNIQHFLFLLIVLLSIWIIDLSMLPRILWQLIVLLIIVLLGKAFICLRLFLFLELLILVIKLPIFLIMIAFIMSFSSLIIKCLSGILLIVETLLL